MWDEDYHEKNVSLLRKINEFTHFRETINQIKTESPKVFELMISSVEPEKLQFMESLLEKAIAIGEK